MKPVSWTTFHPPTIPYSKTENCYRLRDDGVIEEEEKITARGYDRPFACTVRFTAPPAIQA